MQREHPDRGGDVVKFVAAKKDYDSLRKVVRQ